MRVTMLGHACLLCETEDARILMDPWLVGPANFRSWWHLPETPFDPSKLPPLDYLYLSHLHEDHFHVQTLKRLDRRPTVLVPRLYHNRLVSRLNQLGFTRIKELPHAKECWLSRSTRVCCLQMGNDSLLTVADSSGAMLNANDCLQGNPLAQTLPTLQNLAARYRFQIAFLAFGTAGAYPKCYRFEDPAEYLDPWVKEQAMLRNFVQGAMAIRAGTTVPFAGGFALLGRNQMWMNEVKTTPTDALAALQAKAPHLNGIDMNPGDIWDSKGGLIRMSPPPDWDKRLDMIRRMHEAHADELKRIEDGERNGPLNLYKLFQSCLIQNLRTFPLLRRRLNCSVLFQVEGHPGGSWEIDLRRPSRWFREGDSGDWLIRVAIPSALLAEVLVNQDGWETLGISYKLDLYMRKGARAKEGSLIRLINTPSPWWILRTLMTPRFAEFLVRRRKEFVNLVRWKFLETTS